MKNDGTNFFRYAVAVAVACAADQKPTGDVTPGQAADYIRSILDLLLCYSDIEYTVTPLAYPKCGKIPIIIHLCGFEQVLLWFYPQMPHSALALELESLLQGVLAKEPCMTA